jgi:hypothetical protein
MRVGFVLLMLGAVGCGPPPLPLCEFTDDGGGFESADAGGVPIRFSGQPLTVAVSLPRFFSCEKRNVADEVLTEVLDPFNRKVAHTHSAPVSSGAFTTTLTFTPLTPGTYHLTARFEPSLGTAQQDVHVATLRAGPARMIDTGVPCDAFEELPSGVVLCLTSDRKLRVMRDGGLLQTLPAVEFAVAGTTVWTINGRDLQRHVDVGGDAPLRLKDTLDSTVTANGAGVTLFATDDEALLITDFESVRLGRDGGAPIYGAGKGGRSSPTLDALLFVNQTDSFSSTQLCSLSFEQVMVPVCRPIGQFEALGADTTGLWSVDNFSLRHDAFAANGGITTELLSMSGRPQSPQSRHFQSAPVFESNGRMIVPRFGPEGITLDGYDAIPGYTFMPGSSTQVRAQDSIGYQKLFAR